MIRPLALITGASAGLGAAFAWAYAERGHDVALVARRLDRLEVLAHALTAAHGVQALPIQCDLGAWEAHKTVLGALGERAGSVDVLVNNAGFSLAADFDVAPWERQRDLMMTMIVNAAGLAHGVIPGLIGVAGGAVGLGDARRMGGRVVSVVAGVAGEAGVCAFGELLSLVVAGSAVHGGRARTSSQ